MHETIPLQILDPSTELCEVGHTCSAHGSNAQIVVWVSGRSVAQDKQSRSRRPQLASAYGRAAPTRATALRTRIAAIGCG